MAASWLASASVVLFPFFIWLYTAQMARSFRLPKGKRILLLIAHPDDEAMFFAPTIMALTKPELGNMVRILCMSTGNSDGLGEVRQKELRKSAQILGLREEDVVIFDNTNFPDNPGLTWSPRLLSSTLLPLLAPNLPKTPADSPPTATIDVLITFDEHGVSDHPNHNACHLGAVSFVRALMHGREGWDCPVALYSLTSVAWARKYVWVLDMPVSVVAAMHDTAFGSGWSWKRHRNKGRSAMQKSLGASERGKARDRRTGAAGGTGERRAVAEAGGLGALDCPTPLLCVNGPFGLWAAQKAMVVGHKSQMVWFRWGWITLGRYMLVNDLKRVTVN